MKGTVVSSAGSEKTILSPSSSCLRAARESVSRLATELSYTVSPLEKTRLPLSWHCERHTSQQENERTIGWHDIAFAPGKASPPLLPMAEAWSFGATRFIEKAPRCRIITFCFLLILVSQGEDENKRMTASWETHMSYHIDLLFTYSSKICIHERLSRECDWDSPGELADRQ